MCFLYIPELILDTWVLLHVGEFLEINQSQPDVIYEGKNFTQLLPLGKQYVHKGSQLKQLLISFSICGLHFKLTFHLS